MTVVAGRCSGGGQNRNDSRCGDGGRQSGLRTTATFYLTSPALHAVALKYLLAGMAQSGAVLLQTLLNREIIRQLLSAEATCISPAGRLLLRRALVTLRKRKRWVDRQQDYDSGCVSHSGLPAEFYLPSSAFWEVYGLNHRIKTLI